MLEWQVEYAHLSEPYAKERAQKRPIFVFHNHNVRGAAQRRLAVKGTRKQGRNSH